MNKETALTKIGDKVGICASGLCLIHCLATPFLLLLVPTIHTELFDSDLYHQIFAIFVAGSILIAVLPHCRKHGHNDIIAIALIGVSLVIGSLFIPHIYEVQAHILTMIGSVFLITAHLKNMKVRHGKCETKTACSGH